MTKKWRYLKLYKNFIGNYDNYNLLKAVKWHFKKKEEREGQEWERAPQRTLKSYFHDSAEIHTFNPYKKIIVSGL